MWWIFACVNNQWRDLDRIIWPEQVWSISKGTATSLSRWPGAMCIIFLQMQVRGDAPSMFKLTQPTHTWMNVSTTGLTKMSLKKWQCRWSSSSQRIEAVEFLRPIHQAPLIGLRSCNKQADIHMAGNVPLAQCTCRRLILNGELLQSDHASCHFNSTVHDQWIDSTA